ncbi:3-dehydro-L-gulonate 2-dehydrogenase [Pedobacter cryophilus]|uniref:3-dehydro-L-gulonate 2-dehydrogenase n=1 Tax=Pedobacter cryophilus TaxID=2571271 RepID=A0A4U1C145_9SPHI|nr:3-dehydro-L-gulonate 2-dehydrogenase [Pedobacter cryophilus]TKB96767.1 3-dehydro-L-gulonate 2-dehydrogenase [Pedobacter cryophilus]
MLRKTYQELYQELERVLLNLGFSATKAKACATIFTNNSQDGVYSHGLNRFPVFIDYLKKGWIDKTAEPKLIKSLGAIEQWDGQFGPGMLNAQFCMQRAIDLAKEKGMACVALKNTNHWMRGGTYGWQAAEAGCIGINFTNTIAIMPPWGAKEAAIGNNPLIISVPRKEGHIVLDMAMSQFSYGKMQEHQLKGKDLPFYGGYDEEGKLTKNPKAIYETQRPLPAGMWKGSGLALMLDLLATLLSDGNSTAAITKTGQERGISQVFICFDAVINTQHESIIQEILTYTQAAEKIEGQEIYYPGERTLNVRKENITKGIPVDELMWQKLLSL